MALTNREAAREPAETIALKAVVWILSDDDRAERFLSLTGTTPDALRDSLGSEATQAATLAFLTSHEPDLIACSIAIDVAPARIADAARELGA